MSVLLNAEKHAQQRRLSWKSTRPSYRDFVFLSKLLPMRLDESYHPPQSGPPCQAHPAPPALHHAAKLPTASFFLPSHALR